MKMLRHPLARGEERNQLLGYVHRLNRADAQPLDTRLIQNPPQKLNQLDPRRQIPPVRAQIDPAQHNFPVSRRTQSRNLLDDERWLQAAASSAHKGNHAVGAAAVASVLNLHDRTRVIALAANHRSRQTPLLLENVSRQNLRRTV